MPIDHLHPNCTFRHNLDLQTLKPRSLVMDHGLRSHQLCIKSNRHGFPDNCFGQREQHPEKVRRRLPDSLKQKDLLSAHVNDLEYLHRLLVRHVPSCNKDLQINLRS